MGEKRRGAQTSQWKSCALKMAATLLQKEGRVTALSQSEERKDRITLLQGLEAVVTAHPS
jgi:hypothetical protein